MPKKLPLSKYAMFSIASKGAIEYNLQNFGKKPGKACSATIVWSGEQGENVPVTLYSESQKRVGKIGFVLDPSKIETPYAEFYARNTGGIVPKPEDEIKKAGFQVTNTCDFGVQTTNAFTSKYSAKKGHIKQLGFRQIGYQTNYAKWDAPTKTYHDEGSSERFAGNVKHRYFRVPKKLRRKLLGIKKDMEAKV
jgi:hypothetical protein